MPLLLAPIIDLVRWLLEPRQALAVTAVLVLMASAIAVVQSAHETRQMYARLQVLQQASDELDGEYERLLLEESAWADYNRIDQLARQELGMDSPQSQEWVVLTTEGVQ